MAILFLMGIEGQTKVIRQVKSVNERIRLFDNQSSTLSSIFANCRGQCHNMGEMIKEGQVLCACYPRYITSPSALENELNLLDAPISADGDCGPSAVLDLRRNIAHLFRGFDQFPHFPALAFPAMVCAGPTLGRSSCVFGSRCT
jgi:hypothetical protein